MRTTSKDLDRLRRHWDKQAGKYDKVMSFWDRKLFGDTRQWICRRAQGETLEVAIGTGLNLHWYPDDITLTGVELSEEMLAQARQRTASSEREVTLLAGDAEQLPFPDASFDTVVCTFSLCAIPDDRQAVAEMVRVLRPGGLLLLADHVVSTSPVWHAVQRLLEIASIPLGGEHFRRRPVNHVTAAGLTVEHHDRFKKGIVERLAARNAAATTP